MREKRIRKRGRGGKNERVRQRKARTGGREGKGGGENHDFL